MYVCMFTGKSKLVKPFAMLTCYYIDRSKLNDVFMHQFLLNIMQCMDCFRGSGKAVVHSPINLLYMQAHYTWKREQYITDAAPDVGQIVHEHTRLTCLQSHNSKIMQDYQSPQQDQNTLWSHSYTHLSSARPF